MQNYKIFFYIPLFQENVVALQAKRIFSFDCMSERNLFKVYCSKGL